MAGGVHGRVCMGACVAGVCMAGACVAGVCMAGACMAGGVCGRGVCMAWGHEWQGVRARRNGHCSGRYTSYWNAFLLSM